MISMMVSTVYHAYPVYILCLLMYCIYFIIYKLRGGRNRKYGEPLIVAVLMAAISVIIAATVYDCIASLEIKLSNIDVNNIHCNFPLFYSSIFVSSFIGDFHGLINWLGNMLLFVPVGFCIRWLSGSAKCGVFTSLFLSITIEIVQLSYGRISDVIDIILNTSGGILGCLLFTYLMALTYNLKGRYIYSENNKITFSE